MLLNRDTTTTVFCLSIICPQFQELTLFCYTCFGQAFISFVLAYFRHVCGRKVRVEHARPYEERRRLQLEAMREKRYRFVL